MELDLTCDYDDVDAAAEGTKVPSTPVTTQRCHKRGFTSRARALQSVRRASWRARFYRCELCKLWHVTNTEKSR